jgi:DnaK suppressor protein
MSDYNAIKEELLERKDKLAGIIKKVEKTGREPLETDWKEQVVQRENEEVLSALDHSLNREYEQIEHALLRIEKGEYGICENCGERIAIKRLEALPDATLCIICAA